MDQKKMAESVMEIAHRAGAAIMKIYDGDPAQLQVEQKSDESPLTIADREANRIICKGLEALSPRLPIVSEENKMVPFAERKRYTHFWLVDPLDGTKEFIKRNGEFTVNIALIQQQVVELGVVYAPVLNEMYYAIKGEGAWLRQDSQTIPLSAKSFALTDPGLRVVCSRSHLNDDTQAFVDALDQPELVPKGSSLKFLILAKGEAHLYPRLGPTMEWDTAAAQIVLEEAGGEVLCEDSGTPLRYNKEILRNPHFIAYGHKK